MYNIYMNKSKVIYKIHIISNTRIRKSEKKAIVIINVQQSTMILCFAFFKSLIFQNCLNIIWRLQYNSNRYTFKIILNRSRKESIFSLEYNHIELHAHKEQ